MGHWPKRTQNDEFMGKNNERKNLSEMDGIRNRMAGKYQMLDKFSEAVWHQVSHRRKAEDFLAPFTQTQGLRFGSWRGFGEM